VSSLQWKAIDIRLEKLRNECERMILEYEVDLKQRMYLRECEDLLRQKQAQHDARQADLTRDAAEKDRRADVAEQETQRLKQHSVETARKESVDEEEKDVKQKQKKKSAVKRKNEKAVEQEGGEEEVAAPSQPKAANKPEAKKKTATEKPVPRPVSPPVFSPDEVATDVAPPAKETVEEADLSHVADNDLLQLLSQDHGYESEDFGDTATMSLIHPKSPAMLSPKRLKKKAAYEAAVLAKNAASPLRGGAASLADRIRNRITTVAKQPLGETEASSDASLSPPPIFSPPKRALKRRKTAVMSPSASASTGTAKLTLAERLAAASKEVEKESQHVVNKGKKKPAKTLTFEKVQTSEDADAGSDGTPKENEPEAEEDIQQKQRQDAPKKKLATTNTPGPQSRKSKKGGNASDEEQEGSEQEPHIGAITGRSKARQTAKMAALRAVGGESDDDVAGFPDIKTPKVPRKKMGAGGKKKQMTDLAAKRAEFQQILSESAAAEPTEEDEQPVATKKRRRQDDQAAKRKEPVELEFNTPKPKAKKAKTTRNPFPNDELNIMKSPVPLLRAKIAEKKRKEQQEAKKANKRTVSQRGGVDEEDTGYGGAAVSVPASTILPPVSKKGPNDIAAAASDYASRWINSGLVTRAKKNAVKLARKLPSKSPKPASLWGGGPSGGGPSFFEAFVNTAATSIPRLKSTSSVPKQ
jgi:hypothetical protein